MEVMMSTTLEKPNRMCFQWEWIWKNLDRFNICVSKPSNKQSGIFTMGSSNSGWKCKPQCPMLQRINGWTCSIGGIM